MATDLINDIARRIQEDYARQLDHAMLEAFNAGINPSNVVIRDETDHDIGALPEYLIRYQWTVDFSRCQPMTDAERSDYTARLVATGHYAVDGGGRLVRTRPMP